MNGVLSLLKREREGVRRIQEKELVVWGLGFTQ